MAGVLRGFLAAGKYAAKKEKEKNRKKAGSDDSDLDSSDDSDAANSSSDESDVAEEEQGPRKWHVSPFIPQGCIDCCACLWCSALPCCAAAVTKSRIRPGTSCFGATVRFALTSICWCVACTSFYSDYRKFRNIEGTDNGDFMMMCFCPCFGASRMLRDTMFEKKKLKERAFKSLKKQTKRLAKKKKKGGKKKKKKKKRRGDDSSSDDSSDDSSSGDSSDSDAPPRQRMDPWANMQAPALMGLPVPEPDDDKAAPAADTTEEKMDEEDPPAPAEEEQEAERSVSSVEVETVDADAAAAADDDNDDGQPSEEKGEDGGEGQQEEIEETAPATGTAEDRGACRACSSTLFG